MQACGVGERGAITFAPGRPVLFQVQQVMSFEMADVVGEFVLGLAVLRRITTDKDHGEFQVRQTGDDLVHPRRHTAAHIGIGAFQQQGDIGDRLLRCQRSGLRIHDGTPLMLSLLLMLLMLLLLLLLLLLPLLPLLPLFTLHQ